MWQRHKTQWTQKFFIYNVILGAVLLFVAFALNQYANSYVVAHASNKVTDILLDNLPTIDVHVIFSEGAALFMFIVVLLLLWDPKYIPFVIKCTATFILVRSFFMILTHIGIPPNAISIDPNDFVASFSSGNDLFFSGHTGYPLLLALIYWKNKAWRVFFLICSLIGGVIVILGHLHYSIDVFSALFITFGIYYFCQKLFHKDYQLTTV